MAALDEFDLEFMNKLQEIAEYEAKFYMLGKRPPKIEDAIEHKLCTLCGKKLRRFKNEDEAAFKGRPMHKKCYLGR